MTAVQPEAPTNRKRLPKSRDQKKQSAGRQSLDYFRRRRMGVALEAPFDMQSRALKSYRRAGRMLSVRSGMRVLDAGCGLGAGSYYLSTLGAEVVGVDSSPDAVDWATRTYGAAEQHKGGKVSYQVVDLSKWQPTEHFDAIVLADVLEHFPFAQGVDLLHRLLESMGFAEQPPTAGWHDGLFLHLPLTDNWIDWPLVVKNGLLPARLRGEVIDHHGDTTHAERYSLTTAIKAIHAAGGSVHDLELRVYNRRLRPLEQEVLSHNSRSATSHFLAQFITDFDGVILPELVAALRSA